LQAAVERQRRHPGLRAHVGSAPCLVLEPLGDLALAVGGDAAGIALVDAALRVIECAVELAALLSIWAAVSRACTASATASTCWTCRTRSKRPRRATRRLMPHIPV
jgi:hypothetical protein